MVTIHRIGFVDELLLGIGDAVAVVLENKSRAVVFQ